MTAQITNDEDGKKYKKISKIGVCQVKFQTKKNYLLKKKY